MAIKKIKISELPLVQSLKGLFTIGVDSNNKSVKVGLEFVETAANSANEKAATANNAAAAANQAAGGAITAADNANTKAAAANQAAEAANQAAGIANQATGAINTTVANALNTAKAYTDQKAVEIEDRLVHDFGAFATPDELRAVYPTAHAGDMALVQSTDTVWVWSATVNNWVDSDKKGEVTDAQFRAHVENSSVHIAPQERNAWNNKAENVSNFATAAARTNIVSGDSVPTIWGKIARWFTDLKSVAFSGSYNDLSDIPASLPANGGTADRTSINLLGNGSDILAVAYSSMHPGNITRVYRVYNAANSPSYGDFLYTIKTIDTAGHFSIIAERVANASIVNEVYHGEMQAGSWSDWQRVNDGGNAATVNGKVHRDYDPGRGMMLNGLLWDTGNLADYVNFDYANRAAAARGKRLPTQAEWAALIALPHAWDAALKGMWFAATAEDLAAKNPAKCLFFPAAGFYLPSVEIFSQGAAGLYWSKEGVNQQVGSVMLVQPDLASGSSFQKRICVSVRCVQDGGNRVLTADTTIGDDCTSLTERLIPGEFWIDPDGVTKRQVYQCTFVGETPDVASGVGTNRMFLGSNIYEAAYIRGCIQGTSSGNKYHPVSILSSALYSWVVDSSNRISFAFASGDIFSAPYTFTFKYTKAS